MYFSEGVSGRVPGRPDLDKGVHGSPYVIRKPEHADGIALTRFIANWDLGFELEVARPLKCWRIQETGTPLRNKTKRH